MIAQLVPPTQYYMQENTQDHIRECEPVLSTRPVPGNANICEHFTASTKNLQNRQVISGNYSIKCIMITKVLHSVVSWNFAEMTIS
jgi:hypothetical protein